MTKYFTIMGNGIQGAYFKTEAEAQAAADRRNALHGRKVWTVREIWIADPYADDPRPYRTR